MLLCACVYCCAIMNVVFIDFSFLLLFVTLCIFCFFVYFQLLCAVLLLGLCVLVMKYANFQ